MNSKALSDLSPCFKYLITYLFLPHTLHSRTLVSWLFLLQAGPVLVSGPLHLLFPLPDHSLPLHTPIHVAHSFALLKSLLRCPLLTWLCLTSPSKIIPLSHFVPLPGFILFYFFIAPFTNSYYISVYHSFASTDYKFCKIRVCVSCSLLNPHCLKLYPAPAGHLIYICWANAYMFS